jgi:glucokinase
MKNYIAADVGGTQLRAAYYTAENLKSVKILRTSTYDSKGIETPLDRLEKLVASVWPDDEEVIAISIAIPGPINPYTGVVLRAPNIPEWVNLPLKEHFQKRFATPVVVGNDANLAALGEWMFGAGKGHHHLIYLTISTGIGGGIITNDQLLLGVNGLAAELGHITVITDGPICSCGQRGHLEAIAAGPAIARWVEEEISQGAPSSLMPPITAARIAEAGREGDALCQAALARAGYFLGQSLADFLHIFNPSIIVIGGGVSRSGPILFDPMRQSMREHVMAPGYLDNLELKVAAFGDEAGLIGALALGRITYG